MTQNRSQRAAGGSVDLEAAMTACREKMLVIYFLMGSDPKRFAILKRELENGHTLEQNQYPETVTNAYIQFTGIGSSGNAVQLNGLPFAVITNSGQVVGSVMCNLVTKNSGAFAAASYMSATTIKFYQSCSNAGWQPFRHVANISVNDIIYFNATYFTDA